MHDLRRLVNEQTTIISVMNGLDNEKFLGSVYGMDKMLYAVSVGIDALRRGNRIDYINPGKHIFGEAVNIQISRKVQRVQNAIERAGIAYETPPDMIRVMRWNGHFRMSTNRGFRGKAMIAVIFSDMLSGL